MKKIVLARFQLLGGRQQPQGVPEGRWYLPRGGPPWLPRLVRHVNGTVPVRPGQVQKAQGHDEVGKVREEHKDPGDDHHGGGVQVPVLKGGGGHCQVRRQVPKPLGVGKHVVAAGAHHVQAQNQHLRAHEEHGHGPRDPKPAQLCRGGTNAVVAHRIQELAGSIQHQHACVDVILPPLLLCRKEHLEVIWRLMGLEVIASWSPPQGSCSLVHNLLITNPGWYGITGSAGKLGAGVRKTYLRLLLALLILAFLAFLLALLAFLFALLVRLAG
mmetsp:Transcript_17389/g.41199  ORF Transcript_17389/g.41199 Transcript_17389/m.41199 type:complete len:271 (-) Transcript_17389:662-1474(-)